jgi:hypothetical protein
MSLINKDHDDWAYACDDHKKIIIKGLYGWMRCKGLSCASKNVPM